MTGSTKVLVALVSLLVIVGILFVLQYANKETSEITTPETVTEEIIEPISVVATSTNQTIGSSVEARDIESFTFGTGDNDLLFVGGVHGGYEWNSILLAYELMDYFHSNPTTIPENTTVHIIPNLNPDGLFIATGLEGRFTATDISSNDMHATGLGRFNANNVDLNRNFDCKWAPESSWRGNIVSAGTGAFSEPEAEALRLYIASTTPKAVVFWHSQANNVYASECENGVLPETLTLMNAYATAGNYGAVPVFDAYPITGDAEGWLASIGIPAVTVELETRTSIEWSRNLAGVQAVLDIYSE
jgi:hypothetical protein